MTIDEAKEMARIICENGWYANPENLMWAYGKYPYEKAMELYLANLNDLFDEWLKVSREKGRI